MWGGLFLGLAHCCGTLTARRARTTTTNPCLTALDRKKRTHTCPLAYNPCLIALHTHAHTVKHTHARAHGLRVCNNSAHAPAPTAADASGRHRTGGMAREAGTCRASSGFCGNPVGGSKAGIKPVLGTAHQCGDQAHAMLEQCIPTEPRGAASTVWVPGQRCPCQVRAGRPGSLLRSEQQLQEGQLSRAAHDVWHRHSATVPVV